MRIFPLEKIHNIENLKEIFARSEKIWLYGAGYYLSFFYDETKRVDYSYWNQILYIMVTDTKGNPEEFRGIPVIHYQQAALKPGDCVLLTLGSRFAEDVYARLKNTGARVIQLDFQLFQQIPYEEVKAGIQPLIDRFPRGTSGLNAPAARERVTAWSCWWQGTEQAPELVKVCWESQRKNLPSGVEHIVITSENYRDYLDLPEYIEQKVKAGYISLTTLSDILRGALLYKYGGFWMDATLLVVRPLEREILNYPIYTRNLPETQYCTNVMWADWFMYAAPGSLLFYFLMEGFFCYYSRYDKIKYYFTVDYIIAIACNLFPEIAMQLKAVPYNNAGALNLARHLTEPFDQARVAEYLKDTSVQKLTYKLDWSKVSEREHTIYTHLIHH